VNQYTPVARRTHKTSVRSEGLEAARSVEQRHGPRARGSVGRPSGGTAHRHGRNRAITATRCAQDAAGALRSALLAKLRDGELKVCRLSLLPTQDKNAMGAMAKLEAGRKGAGGG